jgi:vacuolar-type H+-ATPase subunit H
MSLEKIIERILSDAQQEAERIVAGSREKAENLTRTAEREASESSAAYLREAEREADLQANQIMAQARLEKKMALLRQKRELLDEVLKKAFSQTAGSQVRLKRQIVLRDGTREEEFDRDRLLQELRPQLEKDIVEVLKI